MSFHRNRRKILTIHPFQYWIVKFRTAVVVSDPWATTLVKVFTKATSRSLIKGSLEWVMMAEAFSQTKTDGRAYQGSATLHILHKLRRKPSYWVEETPVRDLGTKLIFSGLLEIQSFPSYISWGARVVLSGQIGWENQTRAKVSFQRLKKVKRKSQKMTR